jgi:Heparinase II/III-like protein
MNLKTILALFFTISSYGSGWSQTLQRPMIWVKPSDKAGILDKINRQPWAKAYFETFQERVANDVKEHQADAKTYLAKMPLDWSKNKVNLPPFVALKGTGGSTVAQRQALMHYLQTGIDCGIVYFLTDEEKYAQLSTDVLYTVIEGLAQLEPTAKGHNGGGLLYPDDHLREAREIGAQIPILYDFVAPFLAKGGSAYDLAQDKKVAFSTENAEKVFKTYIKLALEQGIVDCNWPVLESSSLVGNTLALHDTQERSQYLAYYLTQNTPHQDALQKVAEYYLKNGGVWPESLGYANEVSRLSTYLMTLLSRYDEALDLGNKYPQIPLALTMSYYLTYPNRKETVLFGDGHRSYQPDYDSYEMAYGLGEIAKNKPLIQTFGALIKSAIKDKSYDRAALGKRSYGAAVYLEPLHLLWDAPEIDGEVKAYPLPTTDRLPFAGITLQRNLSSTGNEKDGLMGFVGGGAHVHGHATGMSMELYGRGHVLGPKAGRGNYTTELHENYFRLFASNNTVIVNGASETEGAWVQLGQNTVELVTLEPALGTKPVSPNHSFSTSRFMDDRGKGAEAHQERTLGIVRTSPGTGFYVDIFRSKSALPNEYHDYIYRNLGEELTLATNGKPLSLRPDDQRYAASAAKEWVQNQQFRHPGWHYFKAIKTGTTEEAKGLTATFTAQKLDKAPIHMKLFINNPAGRSYTTALSPLSKEVAAAYANQDAHTLIIRKTGEAWQQPFALVFEAFEGTEKTGSVQSVESIVQNGEFKGLMIRSLIGGKSQTHYVLTGDSPEAECSVGQLHFKGRYAVATLDDQGQIQSVYVGEGKSFRYKKLRIGGKNGQIGAAYWDRTDPKAGIKTAVK